jgi:hypothetical protein
MLWGVLVEPVVAVLEKEITLMAEMALRIPEEAVVELVDSHLVEATEAAATAVQVL